MKFFPLLYGLFVVAMALALVASSKPGSVGPQTLTVDRLNLSLAPGDRPVLVFKSDVPVDIAVGG
jgi:hypothetical protein